MASASGGYDPNHITSSFRSISISSCYSVHAPPLPTLPFDLIAEILCRLPVKLLLQLGCACKSWNSLISDCKFIKKHLSLSTTRRIYIVCAPVNDCILTSYPFDNIFTKLITKNVMQLTYSNRFKHLYEPYIVGSCNGILCIAEYHNSSVLLWNPSIRNFKELPPFQKPKVLPRETIYGFGFDSSTDNYKVIAVSRYNIYNGSGEYVDKTEVKVHTLGTNFWRSIQEFPFGGVPVEKSGKFVSGTINWLACKDVYRKSPCFIVSFALGNESYKEILQPDYGEVDASDFLTLGVLRNCLCLIYGQGVWIMKEYGNKESWTKLFYVSHMRDLNRYFSFEKTVYILEDEQVLLDAYPVSDSKLIVYDPRNDTFKFIKFQNKTWFSPEVCVESLISPWS